MSVFGAMYSAVSGLAAQGTYLGAIGDNISNANTVGFKQTDMQFSSLVTQPETNTSYTSGGVIANPQDLVTQQGLLQAASSPTAMAITGNGLFVVNTSASPATSNGAYLFTRAGDFTPDKNGNLVNSAGDYLQGWKVASNGTVATNNSNLTNLQTVNIGTLTGTASATSNLFLQANLQSSTTAGVNPPSLTSTSLTGVSGTTDLGTVTPPNLATGDTVTVTNGTASDTFTYGTTGTNPFTTLQGLASAINATGNLNASLSNGSTPTLTISGTQSGSALTIGGTAGTALFSTTSAAATYTVGSMASGALTPQFSTTVGVFDSQGNTRNLDFSFVKDGAVPNQWLAEVYASPASDANSTVAQNNVSANSNGLLAAGTVDFNTDGTLNTASSTLPTTLNIAWAPSLGVSNSSIALNLGSNGQSNGLAQFDSPSAKIQSSVNGTAVGTLSSLAVDKTGTLSATFSNGTVQNLYQIPVATFQNENGLANGNGETYSLTPDSGTVNLNVSGQGGAGTINGGQLESSTVDLAKQFTNLIVAQQAYSASGKVITTAAQMLTTLEQTIP